MARRLAAILAADVVGYSSLMNDDETGTLAALKAHRAEVFDPVIAERGGRLRFSRVHIGHLLLRKSVAQTES